MGRGWGKGRSANSGERSDGEVGGREEGMIGREGDEGEVGGWYCGVRKKGRKEEEE